MGASAPGRVCLFGEHQDYLGLPVIPAAIDLRTTVTASLLDSRELVVFSQSIGGRDHWVPGEIVPVGTGAFRYLRAVTNELHENYQWNPTHGLEVRIESDVPVGSGLSSSAALLVSFTGLLNAHYQLGLSLEEIAYVSYRAERHWCRIDCGQMDQYSSALAALVLLAPGPTQPGPAQTRERPHVVRLTNVFDHVVIGDTLETRTANVALQDRQRVLESARQKLGLSDYKSIEFEDVEPRQLDQEERKRLKCALKIRNMTRVATSELGKPAPNLHLLGQLLTDQHEQLKNNFEVSTPKLDALVQTALEHGAFGAKLTGAGLGGCMVAVVATLTDRDRIAKAIEDTGARAHVTRVASGLTVRHPVSGFACKNDA